MSWQTVKISKLSKQIRGVSYAAGDVINTPKDGYIALLRANNITDKGLTFDGLQYVPQSKVNDVQILRKNDILIAASSGSLSVVGKAGKFEGGTICTFGAFCKVIRPNNDVDPNFFSNFFQTKTYRQTISSLAAGANINNLRNEHIDNLELKLPPLPEQKRIAAILDKADEIRRKREQTIAKLDQLAQSIFVEMFGDLYSNPKNWDFTTLGEVISVLTDYHANGSYEVLRKHVELKDDPDYALMLRTTDLENDDYINGVKYISEKAYEFLEKSKVFGGEIVINKIGSAGKVYFVPYLNRPVSLGMNSFLLRFTDKVNNKFIYDVLKTNYCASSINSKVRGAVTKTITKEAVRSIEIPLPPISFQNEYVEKIQKLQKQKDLLSAALTKQTQLFASLQHQAFTGNL